ncbi:hypothetical protein BG011_004125 [Mortierella polycephala]|uniref:Uncharacterized protein n=1 Tax=Mortierella polycephala TaxID=41804 RepID=A0A9P6QGI1_9FUNG|nr:hypothetical protein BG011_004125 [Mortierella polycephala]
MTQIHKRAVVYIEDSEPTADITFENGESYVLRTVELNKCFKADLDTDPVTHHPKYSSITTMEPDMALNFYMDDDCQEYDFSIISEVREFIGAFASIMYVGQYDDAKQGFYEDKEFSKTVLPDSNSDPNPATPSSPSPSTTDPAVTTMGPTKAAAGTASAGFAIGMGIIGMVILSGMIGLAFMCYRKFGPDGKRGDGRAFMTLSTGQDDYDDEVGLTGENGPHSSALMQSRVGVSFDDERYPTEYRDEDQAVASGDDEVELGAYPQNPAGPKQYRAEPGTQPQNLRAP